MKYYCKKEEVQNSLKTEAILIDTRTTDEYSGEKLKKGAQKAGRIPSAFHIDWAEAIHFSGDKRFKSMQELENIYGHIIPSTEAPCILYCHTGMRSAHTTFVLTQLLGYSNVKNYDGSWTEWSHFNNLPLQKN